LKLDRKCGALLVIANFVAFEQQIILVKTRIKVNRFRNGGDISDRNFALRKLGNIWSLSD